MPELGTGYVGVLTQLFVCECRHSLTVGLGGMTWVGRGPDPESSGGRLTPHSPLHDSPQLSSAPFPRIWLCGGWETPVGGLGATEPTRTFLAVSPPALPCWGPAPAAAASKAA